MSRNIAQLQPETLDTAESPAGREIDRLSLIIEERKSEIDAIEFRNGDMFTNSPEVNVPADIEEQPTGRDHGTAEFGQASLL